MLPTLRKHNSYTGVVLRAVPFTKQKAPLLPVVETMVVNSGKHIARAILSSLLL
jgi:hypothetical protein